MDLRYGRPWMKLAVVTALAVGLFGDPVSAQGSTTTLAADDPPTTTAASSTVVDSSTTTSAADDPSTTSSPSTTVDVAVAESPSGEVPETEETVPGRKTYGSQKEFRPNQVLWSSVRAAEARLAEMVAVRDTTVDQVRRLRRQLKRLNERRITLSSEDRRAAQELDEAGDRLRDRAVAAFVNSEDMSSALLGSLKALEHDEILSLSARKNLLDTVLDQDDKAIEHYVGLRSQLGQDLIDTVDRQRELESQLRAAVATAVDSDGEVVSAQKELEVFKAGSAIHIENVVFPVATPYDLPLIDSWGFPRMPGTPDEHWHEGIDIFAPAGTPLVAAERGVITKVGSGRLGGLTLWIKGESGASWYYAHLLHHEPGIKPGTVVEAGDVVGYVGNSGNAISTPAHLHLQLHPGGGDPVNPYPLLKVISDRELAVVQASGE